MFDLKLYNKSIVIKKWYCYKNRHTVFGNKIDIPKISPNNFIHLSIKKEPKSHSGNKTASSPNGAGQIRRLHVEE